MNNLISCEVVPTWVMWGYVAMYQERGFEWSSPAKIDGEFSAQSRQLLKRVKVNEASRE